MGASSPVARTTTVRARLTASRVSSRNSRTSRPRSPTSATTRTGAAVPRTAIPSSVDLPTPEPAMIPTRWPAPSGTKASRARTPVVSTVSTRRRCRGLGATRSRRSSETCSTSRSGPAPSRGRPRASTIRPSRPGPAGTCGAVRAGTTSSPVAMPAVAPRGMQVADSPRSSECTATTCAGSGPAAVRTVTSWPTPARMPRTRTPRPTASATVPCTTGAAARTAASSRSRTSPTNADLCPENVASEPE